ncbi:MAG TPA: oxidoreductase, partial [Bacteroidales bacterium]|nr:oxidoreductase [Bacteroidales bacterium]
LENENAFLILNMYSIGFSALVADNLVNSHFSNTGTKEYGELYLCDKFAKRLPLGTFLRFVR